MLDCALYLVHITGKVKGNARSDPVETARAVAAATNGVDDMGAVMGNWSTDFSGGTAPTEWMGSKKIMQEYYKKKKPVRYGQCWVFSGVLTTGEYLCSVNKIKIQKYTALVLCIGSRDLPQPLSVAVYMAAIFLQ